MSTSDYTYTIRELSTTPTSDHKQTPTPVKIITFGLLAMLALQCREEIYHRVWPGVKQQHDRKKKLSFDKHRVLTKGKNYHAQASDSALSEELLHAYKVRDCDAALLLLKSLRGKQNPGTIARLLKPWGQVDPEWVVALTLAAQGQVRHLVNVMMCSVDTAVLPGSLHLRRQAASAVLQGCVPVGRDLRTWLQYFGLRDTPQSYEHDSSSGDSEELLEPLLEDEILEAWILGMMMSHDKAKAREAALALSILQLGDKWIPEEQLHDFMSRLLGQGRTDDLPRLFKGDKFPKIQRLVIEGMEQRGLIKQAVKAMLAFGMSEEDFPTVAEAHYRKRIRWCISSGDVDLESYIGTAELRGRPSLQQFWCEQLIDVGHTWLAIAFYRSFPHDDVKQWEDGMGSIKEQIEELEKDAPQLEAQYDAENSKFFQREEENHLSLMDVLGGRGVRDVHLITTVSELKQLISEWEAERTIIGLDSEWSIFRLVLDPGCNQADLVQLATSDNVYLVDIYAGEEGLIDEIGRLVESNNIIVVGFGIAGDLRVLRSSGMEGTRGGVSSPHRIVDLNDLVDGYLPSRKGSSKHQRGLTEVVKYFLGKPLSKVMRLSNWRRRPLSYRQVEYASLDAIVLLKCIEKIQSSIDPSLDLWNTDAAPKRRHVPANNIPTLGVSRVSDGAAEESDTTEEEDLLLSDNSPSPRRNATMDDARSSTYRNTAEAGNSRNPTPGETREEGEYDKEEIDWSLYFNGEEPKLVCPGGMGRLVRKLRGLGVDTLELDSCDPATLEYIAETQHRAVVVNYRTKISKRRWCNGVKCYVLPESCSTMDEQLNAVMQEFKVEVDPDSLLGRCVACNARDWIVTTDKDMVKHEVQPMTLKLYNKFYVCGGCGKVYWEGVMFEKAVTHLRKFVNHDRFDQSASESESSDETSDERTRWARALRDGTIDSTQARKLHDRMISEKLTEDIVHDDREQKTLECIAERNKASSNVNHHHICVYRLAALTYFGTVLYKHWRCE